MNIFLKAFLESAASVFAESGEMTLELVLDELRRTKPKVWTSVVYGGYAFTTGLQPLVKKTSTKVDDCFLTAIRQACLDSAKKYGVDLEQEPKEEDLS